MSQLPLTIPAPLALPLCLLQVVFRGPGQGMTGDWVATAQDWGRRSRGATVRLASLGEVSRDMCQQAELPVLRESLTSESLCPHKVSVLRECMSSESLCAQTISILRESLVASVEAASVWSLQWSLATSCPLSGTPGWSGERTVD